MEIPKLFDKPQIIGVIADVNTGKSMLLYHMIEKLKEMGKFELYTFGFRIPKGFQIYSIEELEQIQNSLIIIDETFTLFDLGNRKNKRAVESTLRLIAHNNNILVLCMVPENVKKFIASKLNVMVFKKCTIPDFINGSVVKRIVESYSGYERGNTLLGLRVDEALVFDGLHYHKITFPYYPEYDSKADNEKIIKPKDELLFKKF